MKLIGIRCFDAGRWKYVKDIQPNLQFLVSIMLENRRIASTRPLFSWLELMAIMMSASFRMANVYLRHRLRIYESETIYSNVGIPYLVNIKKS